MKKRIAVLLALPVVPLAVIFFTYFVFHRKGWTSPEIQQQAIYWAGRTLLSPLLVFCTIRFWTELNKILAFSAKIILGFMLFTLLHWSLSFGLSRWFMSNFDGRNLNLFNTIRDGSTPVNLLVYASSIFILYAWIYYERLREAGIKSAGLERELFQYRSQAPQKPESENAAAAVQNLVIKNGSRTILVPVTSINLMLSYGPYIKVVTNENKTHLLQRPLYQVEKLLPQDFVRVHRSHIVNRSVIREVRSLKNGDYTLVLTNGTEIRASRTYRENINGLAGPDRLMT